MEFEAPGDKQKDEHGRTRLVIDEETLEILKYFFIHEKMDSSKKETFPLIKECAKRAKLTEHQVKVSHNVMYNIYICTYIYFFYSSSYEMIMYIN